MVALSWYVMPPLVTEPSDQVNSYLSGSLVDFHVSASLDHDISVPVAVSVPVLFHPSCTTADLASAPELTDNIVISSSLAVGDVSKSSTRA